MNHKRRLMPLLTLCFTLLPVLPRAQSVPGTINYQGRLTDNGPSQTPFTGLANLQFAVWDDPAAGTALWIEPAVGATPVTVNEGIFSVLLGNNGVPVPSTVFSGGTTRWLEIVVNGETLTPRQAITSTGYADQAENAALAANATNAVNATNSAQLGGIAAAGWQQRVSGTCSGSQAVNVINANGTVGCVSASGGGSINGTTNRVVKFTSATSGGDSLLFDSGTGIGLGTTAPGFPFHATSAVATLTGWFENTNGAADGLYGVNSAATGTGGGAGLVGISAQTGVGSTGVWSQNSAATGTGLVATGNGQGGLQLTGGSGAAITGSNIGSYTTATSAAGGTGVVGVGNNVASQTLVAGSGGAFNGLTAGVFARTTSSAANTYGVYTNNFGNIVAVNYWNGATQFKINGGGSVATTVTDPTDAAGSRRITLYAPESPEIYFTDFGAGVLKNGRAHVELDPRLAANVTINAQHPLRVFIQLEDDENSPGVVVKNKTATGFDVVERGGGKSSAPFQWQVICNRADEVMQDGRVSRNADMRFQAVAPPLVESPVVDNPVMAAPPRP